MISACITYIVPVLLFWLPHESKLPLFLLGIYVPAVFFAQYKLIYSDYATTKRENISILTQEILRNLHERLSRRLQEHEREQIRVNVMIVKRTWQSKFKPVLVMAISIPDLSNSPEWDLMFEKRQGCSGTAWDQKRQIFGDLTRIKEEGGSQWNLTKGMLEITRNVKAILSTPIMKKWRGVVGVLNIDTLDPSLVEFLRDEETREQASEAAQVLAALKIEMLR